MTALTERKQQLPDNIEDLAKFVLFNQARLASVRQGIRVIEKIGVAKEVHAQKLAEAQDLAELVLDAEVRLGELIAQMDKSAGGRPEKTNDSGVASFEKPTKTARLENIGIKPKTAQRLEKLASHPKAVEKAIELARKEDRVVSRTDVLGSIAESTKPRRNPKKERYQLQEAHKQFEEQKKSGVVEISAARKDRADQKKLAQATLAKISQTMSAVEDLMLPDLVTYTVMAKNLDREPLQKLVEAMVMAESAIKAVREKLEAYL